MWGVTNRYGSVCQVFSNSLRLFSASHRPLSNLPAASGPAEMASSVVDVSGQRVIPRAMEICEPINDSTAEELRRTMLGRRFGTILADPPWQFQNRTGKIAPEHRRLSRYSTMTLDDICDLPVADLSAATAHLYLWVPNALLPDGLRVLTAWGFQYKSNIIWRKIRKDGGSDGRGVGFYFRNVTEILLFGVRGKNVRTLAPGRRQVNYIESRKREHSRKPDEQYDVIESCSSGPYLELFSRGERQGWTVWGNQADNTYLPDWPTYDFNSGAPLSIAAE